MTLLRVMGVFALLFTVLMIFAYFYIGNQPDKTFDPRLSFSVPAALYLSFIAGWAIGYTKFFRFPENQKLLLLGVVIGAFMVPMTAGPAYLYTGEIDVSELLTRAPEMLLGSLIGAALQLYFFVIALRYVFRIKLPF